MSGRTGVAGWVMRVSGGNALQDVRRGRDFMIFDA